MYINKANHEGYNDPTACEALTCVAKSEAAQRSLFRPLVYICSPLAGDIRRNQQRARNYCRFALEQGTIPIAPHLLFPQFMGEETRKTRALALHMGLVLVSKCQELWYFGDIISAGMKGEIREARHLGLPTRHYTEACEEVRPDE